MLLTAERIIIDGQPKTGWGVRITERGSITAVAPLAELGVPDHNLRERVLLPGFVNAHSHAFQRLLRGRTQRRSAPDNFWSWRERMYRVAERVDPAMLYVAARQAFIEMLLNGVTAVAEFHYLHHQPDGEPYADPHAMAAALVQAARDAGIRLCLLRTVYLRNDFGKPAEGVQRRFCDPTVEEAMSRMEGLVAQLAAHNDPRLLWGLAAHSLRAVPIEAMVSMKLCASHLPFHVHVSEQRRDVEHCLEHHGVPPAVLMQRHNLLDSSTTLVHATHLQDGEAQIVASCGAQVCICPSTEADLGDGLVDAATLHHHGVPLCLGTDGATLSSVLAEARRLEMHERLRSEQRNVLGEDTAATIFEAATRRGAASLDVAVGQIAKDHWADFVAVDLNDPHLAGCDDASLLATLMFSADSRAVTDVIVGGRFVVQEREHALSETSVRAFGEVCGKLNAQV